VQRLIAETFVVERARRVDAGDLRIGISPRAHPREAVRALMAQLGTAWLVEDDGWYANVTWVDEIFPVAGVHGAQIFSALGATHGRASDSRASPPTRSAAGWISRAGANICRSCRVPAAWRKAAMSPAARSPGQNRLYLRTSDAPPPVTAPRRSSTMRRR